MTKLKTTRSVWTKWCISYFKMTCASSNQSEYQFCKNIQDGKLFSVRIRFAFTTLSDYHCKLHRKQQAVEDKQRKHELEKKRMEDFEKEVEKTTQMCTSEGLQKDSPFAEQTMDEMWSWTKREIKEIKRTQERHLEKYWR